MRSCRRLRQRCTLRNDGRTSRAGKKVDVTELARTVASPFALSRNTAGLCAPARLPRQRQNLLFRLTTALVQTGQVERRRIIAGGGLGGIRRAAYGGYHVTLTPGIDRTGTVEG